MKIEYKFICCTWNKSLNIFMNPAVKFYKLIVIFKLYVTIYLQK